MSVSATSGGATDLDAIVSGGDAFMARLKAFTEAKAKHDAALASLKLGTDVVRAMQDVQAREQAAMAAITEASAQAEKTVTEAKAEAQRMIAEATAQAHAIQDKAAAEADALAREVDAAHAALTEWSDKTRDSANTLMNEAVAARAEADRRLDASQKAESKAAAAMAKAKASHEDADKRHAAITQWRETIAPPPT